MSYYIDGVDYLDSTDYNTPPGTFGYERGGYGKTTGCISQEIGEGLNNTNTLIDTNLQPWTRGWRVLWNMVQQFRSTHSNKWFIPTVNEILQVYTNKDFLQNLGVRYADYWASSEKDDDSACYVNLSREGDGAAMKYLNYCRSRLCRYASSKLLTEQTVEITPTEDSSQVYYTIDNSDPDKSSKLYSSHFDILGVDYIRVRSYKERQTPSASAVYNVETGEIVTAQDIPPKNIDSEYTYSSNKTREEV